MNIEHTWLVPQCATRQTPPNATDPVPPAEQQTHSVTWPRVARKDACSGAIKEPGTDAN